MDGREPAAGKFRQMHRLVDLLGQLPDKWNGGAQEGIARLADAAEPHRRRADAILARIGELLDEAVFFEFDQEASRRRLVERAGLRDLGEAGLPLHQRQCVEQCQRLADRSHCFPVLVGRPAPRPGWWKATCQARLLDAEILNMRNNLTGTRSFCKSIFEALVQIVNHTKRRPAREKDATSSGRANGSRRTNGGEIASKKGSKAI